MAAELGLEPCFVTPKWAQIVAGTWGARWDVAWGSGGINGDRMTRLYMTQPYYVAPDLFYVPEDSPIRHVQELSGKQIGVCAGCTHELYLQGKLEMPGQDIKPLVDRPVIVAYDTEPPGLADLDKGKIDAFICGDTVAAQAVAHGARLRALPEVPFILYSTGFVDRDSRFAPTAFVNRINDVVRGLLQSGMLKTASIKYFGVDYTPQAAAFDVSSIGQVLP